MAIAPASLTPAAKSPARKYMQKGQPDNHQTTGQEQVLRLGLGLDQRSVVSASIDG